MSMWSNIKCRSLAIRALATDTAITEAVKPPLLQRVNKNFWTIWSKFPNKSRCPLGKTFRFGAMGHFSVLAFSSSALNMARNTLMVLSLTGQPFDPNFLCSSGAIDGSILSNCEPFLTWPFPVRLSFLTFWVRHGWNNNFEIEGTQTWFILQILRWCYGRKFHVLDFMKNYSNLKIFSEYQKKKWKCKMFYFQLIL